MMSGLMEWSQRILAELDETRDDNVISMLNTIIDPSGAPSELAQFKSAVQELSNLGLISVGIETFHPRQQREYTEAESRTLLETLEDWFKFDAASAIWDLSKGDMRKVPYPILFLTEPGVKAADRLLNERGYQWWRPRRRS